MGHSNHFITTKSRKVEMEGVKQDVHLITWAYRSGFDGMPRHVAAAATRLSKAWEKRQHGPRFVTFDIEKGNYVFTDLPRGWTPLVGEEFFGNHARCAGEFREIDGKLKFVALTTFRVQHDISISAPQDTFWESFHRQKDVLAARVAGRGMIWTPSRGTSFDVITEDDGLVSELRLFYADGKIMRGGRTPSEMPDLTPW